MRVSLENQRERRERFLSNVVTSLSNDERFVAAWLTGSLSRNEADALSDIDMSVVVSEEYSPGLCQRPEQVGAQTSPERFALFSQFGEPALIHENNNNAPEGGTFTFIMYSDSAVMVDWILSPQPKALRPAQSKLLFDRVGIPLAPQPALEPLDQRRKAIAEQWAFFWMMAAITIKYIHRDDGVFATEWIEHLHALIRDIEQKLNGESWNYIRGSLSQLQATRESQLQSLKDLCNQMKELKPAVTQFTGTEPLTPLAEIEILSSFVNDTPSENKDPKSQI